MGSIPCTRAAVTAKHNIDMRRMNIIGNRDSARALYENREALDKYLAILKELMEAVPDNRQSGEPAPMWVGMPTLEKWAAEGHVKLNEQNVWVFT